MRSCAGEPLSRESLVFENQLFAGGVLCFKNHMKVSVFTAKHIYSPDGHEERTLTLEVTSDDKGRTQVLLTEEFLPVCGTRPSKQLWGGALHELVGLLLIGEAVGLAATRFAEKGGHDEDAC